MKPPDAARSASAGLDSEESFQRLFEHNPAGTVIADFEGLIQVCNRAFAAVLGYDPGELRGLSFLELIFPEDRAENLQWLQRLWSGDINAFDMEGRYRRKDGRPVWVKKYVSSLPDVSGRVTRVMVVITDLTGRRAAEDALKQREEQMRRFVAEAPVAIAMFDREMRYLAASQQWYLDCGLGSTDVVGRSHYDLFPDLPDTWKAAHLQGMAGTVQRNDDDTWVNADGSRHNLRWEVRPWHTADGAIGGVVIFTEDISARKAAELARRLSDRRLQLALAASGAGIWILEPSTGAVEWDARSIELFGMLASETHSLDTALQHVHPDDRQIITSRLEAFLVSAENDDLDEELRIVRPDGSIRWLHGLGRAERDATGELQVVNGIMFDISDRKRAEASLHDSMEHERESAETIRVLTETGPHGIVVVDDQGTILETNRALTTMFGYEERELTGASIEQLLPEASRGLHVAHRAGYRASPSARPMGLRRDLFGLKKDGGRLPVEISLNHVVRPSGGRTLAVVSDIGLRKRAEQALRDSHVALEAHAQMLEQRTAQLRRMASELTLAEQRTREALAKTLHDHLQQLLFSAVMRLRRAEERLVGRRDAAASLIQQALAELDQSIRAARSLSVELFPPVLHEAGLPAALTWLAGWMQEKHDLHVALTIDAQANPHGRDMRTLFFESTRELLFNVVKHAGVRNATVELSLTADDEVRITIADRGVGLSENAAVGAKRETATGLGLASIRERLALLNGRFEVQSAPGEGARFTIIAPRTQDGRQVLPTTPSTPAQAPIAAGVSGSASHRPITVLIADDHVLVRAGLRELLTARAQLQVVGEARDGEEACAFSAALRPDVVIMDVSMPVVDGIEATRRILQVLPKTRVIGVSTHDSEWHRTSMMRSGAVAYCTKGDNFDRLIELVLSVGAE